MAAVAGVESFRRLLATLRWSGPAGVAVLWVGIGSAVARSGFPVGGDQPLSRLVDDGRARALFEGSLVLAAVLFLLFGLHVARTHPVGSGFTPLLTAGMLGQLVAGIVPIGPVGQSNPVHVAAGLVLGGTIPFFLWRYASAQPGPRWRRRATALFLAQAAATLAGIALSRFGVAALAEIIPAVGFHAWILVIAGHRSRRSAAGDGQRRCTGAAAAPTRVV